jgi:hypothetical protein
MAKILAVFGLEIILLVTPMIWPTIPFGIGMFCYGFAVAVMLLALFFWWNDEAFFPPSGVISSADKDRLKALTEFSLWEAACYVSGVPSQKPVPMGGATHHLHQIWDDFLNKKVNLQLSETQAKLLQHQNKFTAYGINVKRPKIQPDLKISRNQLEKYASLHGLNLVAFN